MSHRSISIKSEQRIARVYVESHFNPASVKSIQNRSRIQDRMRSSRITHEGVGRSEFNCMEISHTVVMYTYMRKVNTYVKSPSIVFSLSHGRKTCSVWAAVSSIANRWIENIEIEERLEVSDLQFAIQQPIQAVRCY